MQRQTRLDFEAAEKAYRAFHADYNRILRAGGADGASKTMLASAAGPYLKERTKVVRDYKAVDAREVGVERIVYVRRGGYSSEELDLAACEDSRKVKTYVGNKLVGPGQLFAGTLTVRRVDGAWKVWNNADFQDVKQCT